MSADEKRVADLIAALKPFVAAYQKAADPIGDSDLYNEQERALFVTLGDCRRAARVLGEAMKCCDGIADDEGIIMHEATCLWQRIARGGR